MAPPVPLRGATEESNMTNTQRSFTRLAAAGVASAALVVTAACNGTGLDTVRAQGDPRAQQVANSPLDAAAGRPMLVNCGPYQRTLVRTSFVNGQPVASVDCVAAEGDAAIAAQGYAPQGYATQYAPAAQPVVYAAAPAPRTVRTVSSAPVRRTVSRSAPVERRPVRSKTKSAVIIGSTAAAGAGVGALIGGKKGALIGAIAGGGGALVWDQVTRNKQR